MNLQELRKRHKDKVRAVRNIDILLNDVRVDVVWQSVDHAAKVEMTKLVEADNHPALKRFVAKHNTNTWTKLTIRALRDTAANLRIPHYTSLKKPELIREIEHETKRLKEVAQRKLLQPKPDFPDYDD